MASFQWWVVQAPPLRGSTQGLYAYIQASSAQQALDNNPGSTLIGGPYPTEQAAQAAFPVTGNTSPTQRGTGNPDLPAPTISDKPALPTGLTAIGDFFARLTEASTWVRAGEIVLGLVLLAVGVARITHAVPIATKIAKTAGAVTLA